MDHTSAPWIAQNSPEGYRIVDGGGREIARLFEKTNADVDEKRFGVGRFGLNDHDNAKLISASPVMFALLDRVRPRLVEAVDMSGGEAFSELLAEIDALFEKLGGAS